MITIYLGYSQFYNSTKTYDKNLVCIGDTYESVYRYMTLVRKYPIVDLANEESMAQLTGEGLPCGTICQASFATEEECDWYLESGIRSLFQLVSYKKIDQHIAGISKVDSKNLMIPMVVCQYIARNVTQYQEELRATLHSLKELLYFTNGLNKTRLMLDKNALNIMGTCQFIESMLTPGATSAVLEDGIYKRHPILFCQEVEYRSLIQTEISMMTLDKEYYAALDSNQ